MRDQAIKKEVARRQQEQRLCLVDVGARDGIADHRESCSRFIQVVAFKPHPEDCARLNAAAGSSPCPISYLPQVLGASDGQQPMRCGQVIHGDALAEQLTVGPSLYASTFKIAIGGATH